MKKIFIILIIILLLILIGLGFYFRGYIVYFTTGKLARSFCELTLTPKIWGITDKGYIDDLRDGYRNNNNLDRCASVMAYYANNPKLCEQIINPQEKDNCWYTVGVSLNKPEFCNRILNNSTKENCINKH